MVVRRFNSWYGMDCFGCAILPVISIGREPANYGYKRVFWIQLEWLFWCIQFTTGNEEKI